MTEEISNLSSVELKPIGQVFSGRQEATDDFWGSVVSEIRLDPAQFSGEALLGLSEFSHLEIIFYFHGVADAAIEYGARHPRNRSEWPKVGIFGQRGKNRPNRLGLSRCKLLSVVPEELRISVQGLDAIAGTPILDIKPWMQEFGPLGETSQPAWSTELMQNYYLDKQ